jgi:hypothetical protein
MGENAPDETGSRDVETPEVDIDHSMEKDAWRLIFNSGASD